MNWREELFRWLLSKERGWLGSDSFCTKFPYSTVELDQDEVFSSL